MIIPGLRDAISPLVDRVQQRFQIQNAATKLAELVVKGDNMLEDICETLFFVWDETINMAATDSRAAEDRAMAQIDLMFNFLNIHASNATLGNKLLETRMEADATFSPTEQEIEMDAQLQRFYTTIFSFIALLLPGLIGRWSRLRGERLASAHYLADRTIGKLDDRGIMDPGFLDLLRRCLGGPIYQLRGSVEGDHKCRGHGAVEVVATIVDQEVRDNFPMMKRHWVKNKDRVMTSTNLLKANSTQFKSHDTRFDFPWLQWTLRRYPRLTAPIMTRAYQLALKRPPSKPVCPPANDFGPVVPLLSLDRAATPEEAAVEARLGLDAGTLGSISRDLGQLGMELTVEASEFDLPDEDYLFFDQAREGIAKIFATFVAMNEKVRALAESYADQLKNADAVKEKLNQTNINLVFDAIRLLRTMDYRRGTAQMRTAETMAFVDAIQQANEEL